MGNKDKGRAINNLSNEQYLEVMGANIESGKNTGSSYTNSAVYTYFLQLRNYALNRVKWESNIIPEYELRLIEWNIFHYGKCAMLRPRITKDNIKLTLSVPRIYQCNYMDFNPRTGRPYRISIINSPTKDFVIDINYCDDEFVIFSDQYLFAQNGKFFMDITWEFANKLYQVDLLFKGNGDKLNMPFVFNNGSSEFTADGKYHVIANRGVGIAELIRGAYGRNEVFTEIPESMVGANGQLMHESAYTENHLLEHMELQKKLYTAYFELLGLYTNPERAGVYTVKRLQESGDESGDYITDTLKNTRILCAKEAAEKFGINLSLEIV